MEYRAVKGRCAVSLRSLHVPVSDEQALEILVAAGFSVVEVDIMRIARRCIPLSRSGFIHYRRGARMVEAPWVVDCSSFVKWLYGRRGVWLPRRSIQQSERGWPVKLDELVAGDLIFTAGAVSYYYDDPAQGVGHVGMYSGVGTVIHAADSRAGVIETPLSRFVGDSFRGARRYIPRDEKVITLKTPPWREIESSDDIKWIIYQSL